MELLMILTYTAICVAVFKIFRIPVNKWTLPTAALGGIFLIAGILLVMNYNHPFSKNARIYFATTPIMPTVKGRVTEVPVKPNEPLKDGAGTTGRQRHRYSPLVIVETALRATLAAMACEGTMVRASDPTQPLSRPRTLREGY